jgi:hypothetical protein
MLFDKAWHSDAFYRFLVVSHAVVAMICGEVDGARCNWTLADRWRSENALLAICDRLDNSRFFFASHVVIVII